MKAEARDAKGDPRLPQTSREELGMGHGTGSPSEAPKKPSLPTPEL